MSPGRSDSVDIVYLADQVHHAAELARLHDGEWGHLHPQIPVGERARLLREAAGRSAIPSVRIAVDGPRLVGSAALVAQDMDDRPHLTPWLAAVYVRPEDRRRGLASRLLNQIDQDAVALGVERYYLFTEHEEAFYARRGWQLLEHTDYHGTRVAVMAKDLV